MGSFLGGYRRTPSPASAKHLLHHFSASGHLSATKERSGGVAELFDEFRAGQERLVGSNVAKFHRELAVFGDESYFYGTGSEQVGVL